MNWVDILVLVILVLVIGALVVYFALKKAKGGSVGGCDCSASKGRAIVKAYHDEKTRQQKEEGTCPYCHK
jgi:hypothetical protein